MSFHLEQFVTIVAQGTVRGSVPVEGLTRYLQFFAQNTTLVPVSPIAAIARRNLGEVILKGAPPFAATRPRQR